MPSERVQRQIDRLLNEAEDASARRDWPTVKERAEQGDIEWLTTQGKVYAALDAA